MDELGLNVPVLVAQLLNFFILLVLLRMFLYRPILDMLDRRAQRIREGLEAADQSKEHAAQAEQEVAQQLDEARRQGQSLIGQAQEAANRIQEEARNQARREGEMLLERARSEIQLERDKAIAELRREFGELTVSAAEKVIGQSLDRQAHRRLIDEVLADSTFREN
ncbi:MAG: F0F1 ATP synthase subunit B [Chloroflexi bacterium]|nr:F0F1 ATP synthase subunit B [Chloroflexota bacterium]